MPPKGRRKKAQPKLPAVEEDDQPAQDQHAQTYERQPEDTEKSQGMQLLEEHLALRDAEVEAAAEEMLQQGLEEMEAYRQEVKRMLTSIPKKVRDMTLDKFFRLTDEEAQQPFITLVQSRLQGLLQGEPQPHPAAAASASLTQATSVAESDEPQETTLPMGPPPPQPPAAASTRPTRRTAARSNAAPAADHAPAITKRRTRAAAHQTDVDHNPPPDAAATQQAPDTDAQHPQSANDGSMTEAAPQEDTDAGAPEEAEQEPEPQEERELMGTRRGTRARGRAAPAKAKRTLRSVTNQTQQVPCTPMHVAGGTSKASGVVEATPAAATFAPGFGGFVTGMAPPTTGLRGGFTFVTTRKAGAVPRRPQLDLENEEGVVAGQVGGGEAGADKDSPRQDDDTENALAFVTEGGERFVLDGRLGLAGVPEQHRADIQRQVLLLQQLATAALGAGGQQPQ